MEFKFLITSEESFSTISNVCNAVKLNNNKVYKAVFKALHIICIVNIFLLGKRKIIESKL